ncbi:hypothetical protein AAX11_01200 [Moraxella bovoculi]|nr:hypothetical protein AAX11_01200 [Moraxella bovoculi]
MPKNSSPLILLRKVALFAFCGIFLMMSHAVRLIYHGFGVVVISSFVAFFVEFLFAFFAVFTKNEKAFMLHNLLNQNA